MDNVELSRRLENLLRLGTVAEVDHAAALCRVQTGGILSNWLPWAEHRAGDTRTWDPPTIGEQVLLLSPSGELAAGIVITGIFRTAHPAPSASADEHVVEYPDGAIVRYNHQTGDLVALGITTATIEASGSVTLDTPVTHITGQLEVDGLITYHDGLAGDGGGNGNVVTGPLTQSGGNLSSNGIVLHTHTHAGTGAPL